MTAPTRDPLEQWLREAGHPTRTDDTTRRRVRARVRSIVKTPPWWQRCLWFLTRVEIAAPCSGAAGVALGVVTTLAILHGVEPPTDGSESGASTGVHATQRTAMSSPGIHAKQVRCKPRVEMVSIEASCSDPKNARNPLVCAEGDTFEVRYAADQPCHTLVFTREAGGRIFKHWPSTPGSGALSAVESPTSICRVTLDAYPGCERLFVVAAAEPLTLDQVEGVFRGSDAENVVNWQLRMPTAWTVWTFPVRPGCADWGHTDH